MARDDNLWKGAVELEGLGPVGELFSPHFKAVDMRLTAAIYATWSKYRLRTGTIATLSIVTASPGIAQVEIARSIDLDKSGVNAIINSLEKLGWAERRSAPGDRRRNAIYPTKAGIAALEHHVAGIREAEERILAPLSAEERIQLICLLDRLHTRAFALAAGDN